MKSKLKKALCCTVMVSVIWVCVSMLAQVATAEDFAWLESEKLRAAYFYEDAAFEHLDQLRAAGFNAAFVKFRGIDNAATSSIRERLEELMRQQQGLPPLRPHKPSIDLDRIRAWAKHAEAAGLRFFPVIDFAGVTEARVFGGIIKPTVLRDGSARPKAPSPIDPTYWEQAVKERLLGVAELARETPIEGVLVDFELYAATPSGLSTYNDETHYGDDAFSGFLESQGLSQVELPATQRYAWLDDRSLLTSYRGYLATRVRTMATEIREAVETVNPRMKLGLLPYAFVSSPTGLQGGWFTQAVAAGWGTAARPVLALSEYSFNLGYTEAIAAQKASFERDELHAVFVPGIKLGMFLPEYIGANCYHMALETDGYWIFTSYSLATAPHLLKDVYRIPGSSDAYWQAFEHVNAEIHRSLQREPSYKTDLVLRPQAFAIDARENGGIPHLVPYDHTDKPLQAAVAGKPSQLRRASQWFIYVAEGEKLHLELQRIQIGAFRDAVTYLVEGPSGIVMARGELTRGDNETQQISIAVPAGVYSVRIEAGSGAVSLASSNRHVVTEASQKSPMNIIGRVRPLTFYVPEQTTSFNLHLKASARETVRLVMHDPQGDTVIDDVFDREVTVNFDASGRAGIWNLQLLRAPVGIFEDVEQIYLEGVPPYLSEAAERLLVPSENLH